MSLITAIGAGSLIGAVAAFAVYLGAAPTEDAVATPVAATFAPVPTPTVTQLAADCVAPAVLTDGECVVTTPGRTIVVPAPAASVDAWDDSDEGEESDDGEDADHRDDSDDHEDSDDRDHEDEDEAEDD